MKEYQRLSKKLLHEHGITLPESLLVSEFTQNQADSIEQLRADERSGFMLLVRSRYYKEINTRWDNTPANQMRRKIIALLHYKMNYSMAQLEAWVEKYSSVKKPFNKHSYHELVTLVSQAERVYKSYVKGINQ